MPGVTEPPESWRMLQPAGYGGRRLDAAEFVVAVRALAATDAAAGWLAAGFNAAAHEVAAAPGPVADEVWGANAQSLVAAAYRPAGELDRGRLTGRWPAVAGTEFADWLLLTADAGRARHRVLVPRGQVGVEPVAHPDGLSGAGLGDVVVSGLPIAEGHIFAACWDQVAVVIGAGVAAAVIGAADGLWQRYTGQVRDRLGTSHGSAEVTDQTAIRVARAACDIDAATLQITASLADTPATAGWAQRQAVHRVWGAADHLLGASRRHALDASDPVTRCWQDVQTGCRLAVALLDAVR